MGDCGVCCEKFTSTTRKQVSCGWCDFLVCTACTQRFLLELPDGPSCMNCKHQWDREFLETKFTKTFINGALKKHREEVLFEIEKGLLPETQPYAEASKATVGLDNLRKTYAVEMKKKNEELGKIPSLFQQPNMEQRKDIKIRIAVIKEELKYITELKILVQGRIYNLDRAARGLPHRDANGAGPSAPPVERRAFIKPCPAPECRGFLSTGWKCGLCSVKVCPKCHEIKEANDANADENDKQEHVCDPANVATVEAMAKDSKACPKCGAMIQKIEGCSQMFHTPMSGGCGAIFDWNTLRLHTGGDGTVHNPHWYEWQRHINNGHVPRQLGDVPMFCGGLPHLRGLSIKIQSLVIDEATKTPLLTKVSRIHLAYNHNQHVVLPGYQVNMVEDNRDMRIKYLLNDLTEKRFKQLLQQREKARVKKTHIGQIIRMYQAAIGDILTRMANATAAHEITTADDEITALINYTNENFEKSAKIYTCVKSFISTTDYKIKTREPKPPSTV